MTNQHSKREAIIGSRNFPDLEQVRQFTESLPLDTVILSGGAVGVDRVAEAAAEARGMTVISVRPEYRFKGDNAAPLRRNTRLMEEEKPDHVTAFWDGSSRGTKHALSEARRLSIPCDIRYPRDQQAALIVDRLEGSERELPSFRANTFATPGPDSSLARKGGPLYKGPRPSERSERASARRGENDETMLPSEAIDAATETRERLHAGVAYLTGHLADRERFNRGRHRLTHILTDEYLPLIEQIREIVGTASLQEQLAETERRLSIGWTVKKPGADERFAELATLYAVLSDALSESAVTAPWLDRIGWLEEGAA